MTTSHTTRREMRRIARVITELFAPFPLGSIALTVVAFHSSSSIGDALKWDRAYAFSLRGMPRKMSAAYASPL